VRRIEEPWLDLRIAPAVRDGHAEPDAADRITQQKLWQCDREGFPLPERRLAGGVRRADARSERERRRDQTDRHPCRKKESHTLIVTDQHNGATREQSYVERRRAVASHASAATAVTIAPSAP
jgi:hypothetical protein